MEFGKIFSPFFFKSWSSEKHFYCFCESENSWKYFWNSSLTYFHGFLHFWKALVRKKIFMGMSWESYLLHMLDGLWWIEMTDTESRSVWLNNKRQVHLSNLLVTISEEQIPMLECIYVESSLFFVIFSFWIH